MFLLCMLLNTAAVRVYRMSVWNQNLAVRFVFLPEVFSVYLDADLTDKELMQELQKSKSNLQFTK